MSIERARAHLRKHGLEERIKELTVSSATVALAAEALSCEPARIAKTLSFENGEGAILVLAAGDARIDNPKFKQRFGVNEGVPVYLDESLRKFDYVYPAAGTGASAVYLTIEELERASECEGWVDVTK